MFFSLPLYHPYITPVSPLYHPYSTPISPLYHLGREGSQWAPWSRRHFVALTLNLTLTLYATTLRPQVALTAYGTRYVTPKPPSAKPTGAGTSSSRSGSSGGSSGGRGTSTRPTAPAALTTTPRALPDAPPLGRAASTSLDDLLAAGAAAAAAGEGEEICVDEGYGHDALDHYEYGIARYGRPHPYPSFKPFP